MSSWFDPSGIASLAKNALKEAQKTIDKALDIQEDEDGNVLDDDATASASVKTTSVGPPAMRQSRSQPTLKTAAVLTPPAQTPSGGLWGSIAGTFFDSSDAALTADGQTAVTTPPSAATSSLTPMQRPSLVKSRDSSVSGSVELVTPPTTPGSSLLSPLTPAESDGDADAASPSVCVITGTTTATTTPSCRSSSSRRSSDRPCRTVSSTPSSEHADADGAFFDDAADDADADDDDDEDSDLPGVFIAEELDCSIEEGDEDEEDSRSFNTVVADVPATGSSQLVPGSTAPVLSRAASLHLELVVPELPTATRADEDATAAGLADVLSASTQSFEYVSSAAVAETTATAPHTTGLGSTGAVSGAAGASKSRTISPVGSNASASDDLVKVSSSGHTSGDDGGETATSSDIEIISSPTTNGDSSSTNSVCKVSPSMCAEQQLQQPQSSLSSGGGLLVTTAAAGGAAASVASHRGHARDSSTTSDADSVACGDAAQLRRHIAELNEVLEARELRLVDVGREAAELHERCARLQHALDAKRRRDDCLEVHTVTEEYTQRLAALEKKFQQSIRERDALREQLREARAELEVRVPADSVDRQLRDKEFVIGELQLEGEKLSKQVLQHSNIIKKLRTKERDTDAQLKANAEQLAEQSSELERLKRTLSAKEEVERTQIEAVHRLSGANRRLERETVQLRGSLDDAEQRAQTLQTSMEAARREMHERQAASAQLTQVGERLLAAETERRSAEAKREQLAAEVASLRERLRDVGAGTSAKEAALRMENRELLRRLEELEVRAEEQTEAVTAATLPLVRQAEALQQTLNSRTAAWERQEREIAGQLERAQAVVQRMRAAERRAGEDGRLAGREVERLEEQLAVALRRAEQAAGALQQREMEAELAAADERRRAAEQREVMDRLRSELEGSARRTEVLETEVAELRERVRHQKSEQKRESEVASRRAGGSEEARAISLHDVEEAGGRMAGDRRRSRDNSSPTLSLGRISLADSLSSNLWQMDDLESMSTAGRLHHQPPQHSNASMLEGLQSTLKQRDGENHQLQWELSRQQADRNRMMEEISTLTEQVDDIKERMLTNDGAATVLADVQRQYDALLQMYGEKVEEVQELHLDLDDVKEMYRGQIDELLRQQRAAAAALSDASGVTNADAAGAESATEPPT